MPDARQPAQPDHGGGDGGAAGPGGDERVGLAPGEQVDGGPDMGTRAGTPYRIVVHADRDGRGVRDHPVTDVGRQGSVELAGDRVGADEQETEVGVGAQGPQSAVNHDGGGIVPAEEVDGDPRSAPRPRGWKRARHPAGPCGQTSTTWRPL